jgi:hypothetical protein
MKKQLRYRTLTIALGIVVALLIVLTVWAHLQTATPAEEVKQSSGLSTTIEPVLRMFILIENSVSDSAHFLRGALFTSK